MAFAPSLPQPPAKLRLTSPEQILAAVPYLLGFTPASSLVVLSLRGKQIGLTMRMDLDTPPSEMREVVVKRLRGDGATQAVIILYDPDDPGGPNARPGARLASPLIRAVRREGLNVKDALAVRSGRFWSYLCDNPRCCPPGGRVLPVAGGAEHSRVASTFVAMGTAPLASREALHATVAEASPERRAELAPAFDRALAAPDRAPLERWSAVVARYGDEPRRPADALADDEIAQLVVSLRDVRVRDTVISWTAADDKITPVLSVLGELAPLAPPPFDTQVLASLGWVAYTNGNGALAAAALERALNTDPRHNLSRLLEIALTNGVAPEHLRSVSTDLMADLRQQESQAFWRSQGGR